jgi:hypothetical protein
MTKAIPFPLARARLTPETWIAVNPRWCFVRRDARTQRCAWCPKRIAPGEQYYGTYALALRWSSDTKALIESGGAESLADRHLISKTVIRQHPRCAASFLRESGRLAREHRKADWVLAWKKRLEKLNVAERRAGRARQRATRHAQRMTEPPSSAPAIRAAERLSRRSIRAGLKQIIQGVSVTVLSHVHEEDMRRFTRGLARLSNPNLGALRRKIPEMRKSPVATLSKAINRELASRKSG